MNEKKNRHMTLDDRIEIQECLGKNMSFKAIVKRIGKDPTTVSKEVKMRGKTYTNSFTKTDECCLKLLKAPFVCSGCRQVNHRTCIYPRRKYLVREAHAEYRTVLVESREGIPLNKEEFYRTEAILYDAIRSGQHIYHAIKANDLSVSKSTVYRHIENGYYTISKIDLPRAVKFKTRQKRMDTYVPKTVRKDRTYQDFR